MSWEAFAFLICGFVGVIALRLWAQSMGELGKDLLLAVLLPLAVWALVVRQAAYTGRRLHFSRTERAMAARLGLKARDGALRGECESYKVLVTLPTAYPAVVAIGRITRTAPAKWTATRREFDAGVGGGRDPVQPTLHGAFDARFVLRSKGPIVIPRRIADALVAANPDHVVVGEKGVQLFIDRAVADETRLRQIMATAVGIAREVRTDPGADAKLPRY